MMSTIYVKLNPFFSTLSLTLLLIGEVHSAYAPLTEDVVQIRHELPGLSWAHPINWADSYSANGSCYCAGVTTYDHDIGAVLVDTPLGVLSIQQVCELLGKGPGMEGRPLYNDVQCGNGPANNAGDEDACPGRTEYAAEGCKYIGPKWNFVPFLNTTTSTKAPVIASTNTPTKAPVAVATRPPTKAPAAIIVTTKKPTKSPTKQPTKAPSKPPTRIPVIATTTAPIVPVKEPVMVRNSCTILQLDLWNGATDKLITTRMVNDMKICSSLEMAIDAITDKCVTNVKFVLTGPNNYTHSRVENNAPFFLYGNSGRAVTGQKLSSTGIYSVRAIPNGQIDLTTTIRINVTEC